MCNKLVAAGEKLDFLYQDICSFHVKGCPDLAILSNNEVDSIVILAVLLNMDQKTLWLWNKKNLSALASLETVDEREWGR